MKGLGLPDFVIPIVVGIQESIRNGSLAVESNDFEKVLGRPVTPIKEALTQIVKEISQTH
jgi:NAD(P)H dehydrogenase (quinone)